jgi:tryptophan synthase beta chain
MKTNNKKGYFGDFGGTFVPQKMQAELDRIETVYNALKKDKIFIKQLREIHADFQGCPTSLYLCKNWTKMVGGAKIYLKREDLNHTGAHKINHCMGEMLSDKCSQAARV